jgi:hypothetical protein
MGICFDVLGRTNGSATEIYRRLRMPIYKSIAGAAGDRDVMPYLADILQALDGRFDFGQVTTTVSPNRLENALVEASQRCTPVESTAVSALQTFFSRPCFILILTRFVQRSLFIGHCMILS